MNEKIDDQLNPEVLLKSLSKRIEIIDNRLEEIKEGIEERKQIGDKVMRSKQKKKSQWMGSLTNPHKLKKKVEGDDLYEMQARMRKKIDGLDQEINQEMIQQWKDIQKLTQERRELKERREELERRKEAARKVLEDLD